MNEVNENNGWTLEQLQTDFSNINNKKHNSLIVFLNNNLSKYKHLFINENKTINYKNLNEFLEQIKDLENTIKNSIKNKIYSSIVEDFLSLYKKEDKKNNFEQNLNSYLNQAKDEKERLLLMLHMLKTANVGKGDYEYLSEIICSQFFELVNSVEQNIVQEALQEYCEFSGYNVSQFTGVFDDLAKYDLEKNQNLDKFNKFFQIYSNFVSTHKLDDNFKEYEQIFKNIFKNSPINIAKQITKTYCLNTTKKSISIEELKKRFPYFDFKFINDKTYYNDFFSEVTKIESASFLFKINNCTDFLLNAFCNEIKKERQYYETEEIFLNNKKGKINAFLKIMNNNNQLTTDNRSRILNELKTVNKELYKYLEQELVDIYIKKEFLNRTEKSEQTLDKKDFKQKLQDLSEHKQLFNAVAKRLNKLNKKLNIRLSITGKVKTGLVKGLKEGIKSLPIIVKKQAETNTESLEKAKRTTITVTDGRQ